MMDDIGYNVNDKYVDGVMEVFAKFDDDHSGLLEYDEFRKLWEFLVGEGAASTGQPGGGGGGNGTGTGGGNGGAGGGGRAGEEGGGAAAPGELGRLRKKVKDLNDKYIQELQEHRDDVEGARDEIQKLRDEFQVGCLTSLVSKARSHTEGKH